MKKATLLVTLMLLLALLCDCESEDTVQYGFDNGRYVLEQSDGDTATPYILINEDGFSLVLNIAVSYQPSGTVERDGNKLVLNADFAGEKYAWTFTLTGDNTLRFSLSDSDFLISGAMIEDASVFVLAAD